MNKTTLAIFSFISLCLVTCQGVRAQKRTAREVPDFGSIGPIRVSRPTPTDPPVEERYSNIRVLQGLPSSQLIPVMALMSNSLGVTCAHCHDTKHFDEDQLPEKTQARQMIRMTRAINSGAFDGNVQVTCNSCHNGHLYPNPVPELAAAGWRQPEPARPDRSLPASDAIVSRFASSLGVRPSGFHGKGEVRVLRGEETLKAPIEVDIKSPEDVVLQSDLALRDDLSNAVGHWFALNGDLEHLYKRLKVTGHAAVDGKDALVIEAQPAEGRPERLYFDVPTGLIVRIHTEMTTPMGFVPEELTLADYAPVGGAMLPRTLRWERGEGQTTIALTTVSQ